MPDSRRHRGPHQRDAALFTAERLPGLRLAVHELSWLLGRGYSPDAALKLVGDHHQLQRRQRRALLRSACAPDAAAARKAATRPLAGRRLAVDGFNLLITVEAALGGGVLLRGADGRLRDLASVHGSYRRVAETQHALDLLATALAPAAEVLWVLDRPVSNSGRVAAMARDRGWQARLEDRADATLLELALQGALLCTSDGPLMDRCVRAGGRLADATGPLVAGLDGAWLVLLDAPA